MKDDYLHGIRYLIAASESVPEIKNKGILISVDMASQLIDERDTAFKHLKRLHEITEQLRDRTLYIEQAKKLMKERDRIFASYAGRF